MKSILPLLIFLFSISTFAQSIDQTCEVSDQTIASVDELLIEELPIEAFKLAIGGILMVDDCYASSQITIEETQVLVDRLISGVLTDGGTKTKAIIQEFIAFH